MFREHERILPAGIHPHGEDFLVRKIEQLEWLLGDLPSLAWEMIAVDDGCPDRSGHVALEILAERAPDAPARVIFLEDGIRERAPVTSGLESTDDSRKGGSIQHGMWTAATEDGSPDHVIAYTDADLSTHLGQLGLLIDPILRGGPTWRATSSRTSSSTSSRSMWSF